MNPFSTWLSGIRRAPAVGRGAPVAGDAGSVLDGSGMGGARSVPVSGAGRVGDAGRALGSFEHGGEVPRDGTYELEKGEVVTPAKKTGDGKRDSEYRRVFLKRKEEKK